MDSVCDFQRFVIETQENKLRLDVYLAMVTPYTRSYIKSLIDKGHVTVNGKNEKAGRALKSGDIVPTENVICSRRTYLWIFCTRTIA